MVGFTLLLHHGLLLANTLVVDEILGPVAFVVPMKLPPRKDIQPPYLIPLLLILHSLKIMLSSSNILLTSLQDDGTQIIHPFRFYTDIVHLQVHSSVAADDGETKLLKLYRDVMLLHRLCRVGAPQR